MASLGRGGLVATLVRTAPRMALLVAAVVFLATFVLAGAGLWFGRAASAGLPALLATVPAGQRGLEFQQYGRIGDGTASSMAAVAAAGDAIAAQCSSHRLERPRRPHRCRGHGRIPGPRRARPDPLRASDPTLGGERDPVHRGAAADRPDRVREDPGPDGGRIGRRPGRHVRDGGHDGGGGRAVIRDGPVAPGQARRSARARAGRQPPRGRRGQHRRRVRGDGSVGSGAGSPIRA